MMTGGLSLAPGIEGAEDPTVAQTPAGLFPGAVV